MPRRVARRLILASLSLAACSGKSGDKGSLAALDGSCVLAADNALRGACTLHLDEAAAATLDLRLADVHLRFESPEPATEHTIPFYGLIAEQPVRWTLSVDGGEASGTFETPALPEEAAVSTTVRQPGLGTVDQVFAPRDCGSSPVVDLFDGQGRVRWYQSFDPDNTVELPPPRNFETVEGLRWTDEGTLLGIVARRRIAEYDLFGVERTALLYGEDFDRPVHHDLFRHEGRLYALEAFEIPFEEGTAVADGVVVFDEGGAIVERWSIPDHHPLPADLVVDHSEYWSEWFDTTVDLTHTNSLSINAAGEWLIGLRNTAELLIVDGDTGALTHSLRGTAEATGEGALTLRSEAGREARFSAQHDANWLSDDRLRLFDNGDPSPTNNSAALDLRLDRAAGEAVIEQAWPTGRSCVLGGSAFDLPSGHVLVGCAEDNEALEVDPSGGVQWTMRLDCQGADIGALPRFIPVSLLPEVDDSGSEDGG